MTDSGLPEPDESTDDALAPGHPAGTDAPVSAGEVLSGEGTGTGKAGPAPATGPEEPTRDAAPGDDS
jgi:hypothetical protein